MKTEVAGRPVRLRALPPLSPLIDLRWHAFRGSETIFGLDVETTGIEDMGAFNPNAELRMIQFGTATEGWALDPHDPYWRPMIVTMLADESKRFVSHTDYDVLWVRREFGIDLGQRSIDTHVMAGLLFPGERSDKGLKALCDAHIDTGLSQAEARLHARMKALAPVGLRVGRKMLSWGFTNIPIDDPAFTEYGGLDAVYVRVLLDHLGTELRRRKMAPISKREQRIARLATAMTTRGLLLDREYTEGLLDEIEGAHLDAREWLEDLWGFKAKSPKRGAWLAERGVQAIDVTPGGEMKLTMPSATDQYGTLPLMLAANRGTEVEPVLEKMVTVSETSNLYNNLRQILDNTDPAGIVHATINTQAAVTGRMSIVRPALQTFKKSDKRLRRCFLARPGHVLIGADYAGQETRIAAAYSRDPALLKVVAEDLNQHELTAQLIFGPGWSGKKVNGQRGDAPGGGRSDYDKAKTLDFAQQYGAGPKRIAAQLDLPYAEARALWAAWREAYAGLVEWTEKMASFALVVNDWGRQIPADQYRSYANGNYSIQSTGREVLGDAMIALADAGWGETLWLVIHDEILLEVREDEAPDAVLALERCMYAKIRGIPLTATASILGRRWSGA